MSQNAFVKKRLDGHTVQVSLMRQMECGLSCMGSGGCDHCGMKPQEELLALASDSVGVQPGDIVEVDSRAGSAVGVSMLVFVLPIVTMILGYVLGQSTLHLGEWQALLAALAGLDVGFLPAWAYNRALTKKQGPEFTVVRRLS